MKIIIYFCCFVIMCISSYAKHIEKNVINGLKVSLLQKNSIIPFSGELFGHNVYLPKTAKFLQNLVASKVNGTSIIFDDTEVICIANKKNDIYNGELSIYPDGIFSINVTVKDGILDGKCYIIFQPFKYSFNSKLSSVSNYDMKKIPAPSEHWIRDGKQDFTIKTEGRFKNGKKFEGSFLKIENILDLRIVTIQKYSNYKLISVSSPTVFKIKPWVNGH